jgi:membrane protease YdiL (CAAX protease family)
VVLYWRLLRPRILDWQGLGFGASLGRRPLRAFAAGLALGLVALLAGGVVVQCLQWLGLNTSGQQNALKSVQHAPAALFVPFALTAGVTAPLAEEVFFRGYVFRALAVRYGMPVGVAASSICFGALHLLGGVTWEVAGLVVIGAILAYGYAATGNMVTNITAHMVNNVVGLILLYNH